jgi:hypothetical protein
MSISTYAELRTAIASYLNRSDLTGYIPDFISLGIQRINYGGSDPYPSQPLRVPAMQANETGTITSSSIAFPAGFLEPIRIAGTSNGQTWTLNYVSPAEFSGYEESSALPSVYTYLENSIKTGGTGAASYKLDYYEAFDALTADADTNWLLTNAPSVLLYAALVESAPFLMADDRISGWFGLYKSAIAALNRTTMRQGGGSLAVRVVK